MDTEGEFATIEEATAALRKANNTLIAQGRSADLSVLQWFVDAFYALDDTLDTLVNREH